MSEEQVTRLVAVRNGARTRLRVLAPVVQLGGVGAGRIGGDDWRFSLTFRADSAEGDALEWFTVQNITRADAKRLRDMLDGTLTRCAADETEQTLRADETEAL